jgi:hypothetical protein
MMGDNMPAPSPGGHAKPTAEPLECLQLGPRLPMADAAGVGCGSRSRVLLLNSNRNNSRDRQ